MAVNAARVKLLFLTASDFADAPERSAYLDRECAGDAELRARVEALLRANEAAPLPAAGAENATNEQILDGPSPTVDYGDPTARIGAIVGGKYKLIEEIGEGGMGQVFMAQQTEPVKRAVAVKVIKAGMDSKAVLARFEAERQALAMMDHPNIAKVLDAGSTAGGRPYFVMELVKGQPITSFCDDRKLTPRQRLELFVPVCHAIQHAHQKGIIHRDIKPSNVLIAMYDDRPVPKVIDFGVAKAAGQTLTDQTLMTGLGAVVGTAEYMSPEQANLNNLDIDTRSDVYSLGVLLYELLTGSTPVDRKSLGKAALLEILRIVREVEAPKPSHRLSTAEGLPSVAANRGTEPAKLSKLIKGELDWLVMKALEKDRTRRYETANGLARDIQRYLADEVVEARPPSAGYRLRKFVKRHKAQVVAVSLLLLTLVGGIVGTAWQAFRAVVAEREARGETARAREAEANARAVADYFVKDMFRAGDTFRGDGAGLTIEQVLDNAARKIDTAFRDQPEVAVELHKLLLQIYYNQGLASKSEAHARKVVEIQTHLHGPEHEKTLEAALVHGEAVHNAGREEEGISRLRQGLADAHRLVGPKHRIILLAYYNLGLCLDQMKGGLKEGETYLRKAAAGHREVGADAEPLERVLYELAQNLYGQRRQKEAEPIYREALDLARDRFGEVALSFLYTESKLGQCLSELGKHQEAEVLLRKSLAGLEQGFVKPNIVTYGVRSNLAESLRLQGKLDEALPLQSAALKAHHEHYGPRHRRTMQVQGELAMIFKAQKKYADAAPLFRQVVDFNRLENGPQARDTLTALYHLVDTLVDGGEQEAAVPLAEELVVGRRQANGETSDETLKAVNLLAFLYIRMQRLAKAEELLTRLVPLVRERNGDGHEWTQNTMRDLGYVYSRMGNHEAAEPLQRNLLDIRRKHKGDSHEETLFVQFDLANTLSKLGRYDDAAIVYADGLEKSRKSVGEEHRHNWNWMQNLAMTWVLQGQLNKAEQLVIKLTDQQLALEPEHPDLATNLAILGLARLKQKKFVEAEPPLRKAVAIRAKKLPGDWRTLNTESMLGGALTGQRKYAEAEALLLAGYDAMKQRLKTNPPPVKDWPPDAAQRLIDLYDRWGKPVDAAKWRAELAKYPAALPKKEAK